MISSQLFRKSLTIATLSTAALHLSCGKDVRIGYPASADLCTADQRLNWTFIQANPIENRKVDLLFVMDTSKSLASERSRLARSLPRFLTELPLATDYRISVMLAHGGSSPHSGRLLAGSNGHRVLDSSKLSTTEIQQQLQLLFEKSLPDRDEANGEALLYSLTRGLKPEHLAESRRLGFFRPDAALSIVFVTDENDVCSPPELHGYSSFPDYVPSTGGIEPVAYQRYCDGISPESVLASLRTLQGSKPLTFGALIHRDPAKVPRNSEDSIGHGVLELIEGQPDSVFLELSDSDYSPGMTRLGNVVSRSLTLRTQFPLEGPKSLDQSSISTEVDGTQMPFLLETGVEGKPVIRLASENAGRAGSLIAVTACPAE